MLKESVCLASRPPVSTEENQIQKWLTHKFPQGYADLEKSLERLDTKQMGTVCHRSRWHSHRLVSFDLVTSRSVSK
jgi:hypothetical protein